MTVDRDPTQPFLIATTIDCHDLEVMTAFWGALLGVETQIHEPFGFLAHGPDRKVTLWLQRVDDEFTGKNRLHIDLAVHDLEAALETVVELGGAVGEQQTWETFVWRTCTDPEGNVFDIMQASEPAPTE